MTITKPKHHQILLEEKHLKTNELRSKTVEDQCLAIRNNNVKPMIGFL